MRQARAHIDANDYAGWATAFAQAIDEGERP
jgi:hypothetical protein